MAPAFPLPRFVRGCFFCLFLVAMAVGGLIAPLLAAPYTPRHDDIVLERLSADARADALRRLSQARRSASAQDPSLAVGLARHYIERSRATADPRLLGYAQGILAPWWESSTAPADVVLLRATILQSRHRFDAALVDLDRVLGQRPHDAQALLTRATVLRVQGRYPQAAQACGRMAEVEPGFSSTLCGLALRSLSGDLHGALQEMTALQRQAAQEPPALRTWFDAEFAEMLERAGRRDEAEAVYRAALRRAAADPGLVAAYADFLLDAQRAHEAEILTAPALDIDAVGLRNAIARHRLGQPERVEVARLEAGFIAAQRRDEAHLREASRFLLEVRANAGEALRLAQQNWGVQREPADARLLIEAADRAGRPSAAAPAWDWLAESGLQDRRIAPRADRGT